MAFGYGQDPGPGPDNRWFLKDSTEEPHGQVEIYRTPPAPREVVPIERMFVTAGPKRITRIRGMTAAALAAALEDGDDEHLYRLEDDGY